MSVGAQSNPRPSDRPESIDALLPDRLPMVRSLDPAAALAYRTPLMEHTLSADSKAAGVLTLLGMMFTVLARLGTTVSDLMISRGLLGYISIAMVAAFAACGLGTVVQAFRTIAP